jgi:ABC-type oligopeptide transport system substrate-binding subunit
MKFMTGSSSNDMMVADPKIDGWYTAALNATNKDQIKQILVDENRYVVEQHLLISLVDPNNFYLSQPWLKGFSGQNDSTCQSGGPLLAFEWWPRFWIDR